MTFEITPGTIYSAYFPFSDLGNKKKRPVLALSGKDENDDVRIAFITKTAVDEAQGFVLESTDFEDEMLKHQSHIRVDKTFNLHSSRIEKPVVKLSDKGYGNLMAGDNTPGVYFTRFLSMDVTLSKSEGALIDTELDLGSFEYGLGFQTWKGETDTRPIQLPAVIAVVYALHRAHRITGILVFDHGILLARYEEQDIPEYGRGLFDYVSGMPFIDFPAHLIEVARRLPDYWQTFNTPAWPLDPEDITPESERL